MVNMNDFSVKQREELTFTEDEFKELETARKMQITLDDDCPVTTPERAIRFKRVNPPRKGMSSNPA